MKLLIDGDVVRYRCGFAAQKTRYVVYNEVNPESGKDPGTIFENAKEANAWMKEHGGRRESFPEVEPVENALHSVKVMLQAIQDKWPDADMGVYFSCSTKDNWRTKLFPQYKANRPDRRPEHDAAIREYMNKRYRCITGKEDEADDLIAMTAETCRNKGEDYVICSIDKDLKQIGGKFYDFTKDTLEDIPLDEAAGLLELQKITGDSTDNIPGISGWGAAKAARWLAAGPQNAWDAYQEVFDNVEVAWYHYCLNQALVTLPSSETEKAFLVEEVEHARKEIESLQGIGAPGGDGPGSARVGETDTTEVETTC